MELASILPEIPSQITESLDAEFKELSSRFYRSDWRPSELNAARFSEALVRYLEWKDKLTFTPKGTQLDRQGILNSVNQNATLADSIRFQLRAMADLLLEFRNKRDVAHLGAEINVNEMDSRLLMRMVSWCLAEIVRLESGLDASDIQKIVDDLSAKEIPVIQEIAGRQIVLNPALSSVEQSLLLLYQAHPESLTIQAIKRDIKYGNITRLKNYLKNLENRTAQVHFSGDEIHITAVGIAWVEENIEFNLGK
jgi:hypothetical protein